jgi:hypothetical protein
MRRIGRGRYATFSVWLMSAFLLGAISATAVALHFGIRFQPKFYTERVAQTVIDQNSDPAAVARLRRSDRLFAGAMVLTNEPAKASFETAAEAAVDEPISAAPVSAGGEEAIADIGEDLLPSENYGDGNSVSGVEIPEKTGKRVLPSLYYDAAKRQRVIGNFQTRSFPGESETCAEIGQSMAKDDSGNSSALQTLADTGAITVLKICAANGSVIISCRAGQVTISPRQARPDDKCEEYRAKRLAQGGT